MVSGVVGQPTGFGLMDYRYSRTFSVSYGSAVCGVILRDCMTATDTRFPTRRVRKWIWKAYLYLVCA